MKNQTTNGKLQTGTSNNPEKMTTNRIHFEIGRNLPNGETEQIKSSKSLTEISEFWDKNNYSISENFIDVWEAKPNQPSYSIGDINVRSLNLIGFRSEENCAECGCVFDTNHIISECPECRKQVISCNACGNCGITCALCRQASFFINYTK